MWRRAAYGRRASSSRTARRAARAILGLRCMKPILCLLLLYTAFVAANGSDSDEAELSIRIRPHGTPHHAHDDILESVEIDNHSDLFDISDEPVIEDPNEIQFIQSSSEKTRRTNKFGTGVVMAEGFTYRKERVLRRMPGFSAYRCVERLCPARVHVNDETLKGKVIRKHKGHNPDYTCVQVREALDKLEEIGRKTALETDRKSVNRDALQAVRNKLTDEALKKHLSANSSVLGRDFVSRREIIKAEGFKQDTEEDFLLEDINEDGLRAVIFMTESGRKMLEKSRDIAFDGTFGIVPQHMYQLVTIHAYIEASSVPIVYCITNHKTRTLYRRLFEAVDARLEQKPRSCMSDFELAAIQAAREVWPEIDRKQSLNLRLVVPQTMLSVASSSTNASAEKAPDDRPVNSD
ncbi:hypothetical protein QR680_012901 [Steinernema hermaphroditum]|uniref:MULE transposase domain-containing protein n=1 Tax=Steinernema hermaphroditum TaxID=289476 RepID=A0AA39M1K9_9BILA|nr:hypothetical protein QR680_012901 [Steinernema hermaphroditum]